MLLEEIEREYNMLVKELKDKNNDTEVIKTLKKYPLQVITLACRNYKGELKEEFWENFSEEQISEMKNHWEYFESIQFSILTV